MHTAIGKHALSSIGMFFIYRNRQIAKKNLAKLSLLYDSYILYCLHQDGAHYLVMVVQCHKSTRFPWISGFRIAFQAYI